MAGLGGDRDALGAFPLSPALADVAPGTGVRGGQIITDVYRKTGLDDPGLQIVADRLPGGAAEIGEGVDMRGDPVRQLLAPDRLGVSQARRAQDGDEDLHRDDLAGAAVDDLTGA